MRPGLFRHGLPSIVHALERIALDGRTGKEFGVGQVNPRGCVIELLLGRAIASLVMTASGATGLARRVAVHSRRGGTHVRFVGCLVHVLMLLLLLLLLLSMVVGVAIGSSDILSSTAFVVIVIIIIAGFGKTGGCRGIRNIGTIRWRWFVIGSPDHGSQMAALLLLLFWWSSTLST